MNMKSASLMLLLVLLWATVGGCPTPADSSDTVNTPTDATPTGSSDDSNGDDSTPADLDDGNDSSDDGQTKRF